MCVCCFQGNDKKGEGRGKELVSLCQLPLVLDPEAKARIMQGEALLQKQHEVQASAINVCTLHCSWLYTSLLST